MENKRAAKHTPYKLESIKFTEVWDRLVKEKLTVQKTTGRACSIEFIIIRDLRRFYKMIEEQPMLQPLVINESDND